jgi:hypothetical protein
MKVLCTVEEVELETDRGSLIEGVQVTCTRCEAVAESFGTSTASIRRCFFLLREQCDEENYYTDEEG